MQTDRMAVDDHTARPTSLIRLSSNRIHIRVRPADGRLSCQLPGRVAQIFTNPFTVPRVKRIFRGLERAHLYSGDAQPAAKRSDRVLFARNPKWCPWDHQGAHVVLLWRDQVLNGGQSHRPRRCQSASLRHTDAQCLAAGQTA